MVGAVLTILATKDERTEHQVITSWRRTSSDNAARPSARLTLWFTSMVDNVEPKATVTTRSNEFIFDKVRLPLSLSSTTSPA